MKIKLKVEFLEYKITHLYKIYSFNPKYVIIVTWIYFRRFVLVIFNSMGVVTFLPRKRILVTPPGTRPFALTQIFKNILEYLLRLTAMGVVTFLPRNRILVTPPGTRPFAQTHAMGVVTFILEYLLQFTHFFLVPGGQ